MTSMSRARPVPTTARACAALLLLTTAWGCGDEPSLEEAAGLTSPAPMPPTDDQTLEELVKVDGVDLFVRCAGAGEPTVVFLHGADPELEPTTYSRGIEQGLTDEHRFCVYDRRNVGRSQSVPAPQQPEDMVSDLDGVLQAVEEEGPYVLLGASFGGLLAYAYAGTHPGKVAGIVALDSMFPDELPLERFVPRKDRYVAYVESDEAGITSKERIAHYKMLVYANRHLPSEPGIPLTYLASSVEPRNTLGVPAYDDRIHEVLEDFVDRFEPGTLMWVDAPHFMEQAIPGLIAEEVRDLVDLHVASGSS